MLLPLSVQILIDWRRCCLIGRRSSPEIYSIIYNVWRWLLNVMLRLSLLLHKSTLQIHRLSLDVLHILLRWRNQKVQIIICLISLSIEAYLLAVVYKVGFLLLIHLNWGYFFLFSVSKVLQMFRLCWFLVNYRPNRRWLIQKETNLLMRVALRWIII